MSNRYRALSGRSYPWSDLDPDRRNAVFLIGGIAVVVILAIGLISYGYYKDRVKPNHATVLRLGDQKYDYNFLKRRVQADLRDGKVDLSKETAVPSVLGDIEHEEIVRQIAKRDGITITDAEVMSQIAKDLGLGAETPRNQVAPVLRIKLLRLGLPLSDYENQARAEVAENKVKKAIEDSIPIQAEQVSVRIIQTSSQASAIQAKQRIQDGESFAIVAAALSVDKPSKSTGGDIGYVTRGALPKEVEKVAFEITGLSEVIETKSAFFVIQVLDKKTDIVGTSARDFYMSTGFSNKLQDALDALGGSKPTLTQGQVQRILRSLSVARA